MLKGYYTDSAYWGWIGDRYIQFESESAYKEYISQLFHCV